MLLSGSGHLFQCTLQLKFTKILSSHTLIIAALYGMALPNNLVRNFKKFKNFKIMLSELSLNLAMILVSRFLLNSLGWDNLSVRRAKQKGYLISYKCINNLTPAYLCNSLFVPKNTELRRRRAQMDTFKKARRNNIPASFSKAQPDKLFIRGKFWPVGKELEL